MVEDVKKRLLEVFSKEFLRDVCVTEVIPASVVAAIDAYGEACVHQFEEGYVSVPTARRALDKEILEAIHDVAVDGVCDTVFDGVRREAPTNPEDD